MNDRWRGSVLVLFSALAYGFLPIFARLAYGSGVGVQELLVVRFALSFLIMGVFLGLKGKISIPSRNQFLVLLGLGGIGYFLLSILYFTALLYIPVSVVVLVFHTYPAFVVVGSFALGWERVSTRVILSLLLALMGLALVANPAFNLEVIGLLMALGSAIAYTCYILVSTRALKGLSGEVASLHVIGASALSFGISGSLTGSLQIVWNFEAWLWVLMIAIISTTIAITTFFQGLKLIGPSRTSILSTMELITSVVAAFIIFHELLNLTQLLGGLLILFAIILAAIPENSRKGKI